MSVAIKRKTEGTRNELRFCSCTRYNRRQTERERERANHKYVKREWNNGRWVYTYKDDISSRRNNRNAPNPNDTTIRLAAQKTAPSMANKTHSKQNKKHLTETGKNTHNREYYSKYVLRTGNNTRDVEVDGAHAAEFGNWSSSSTYAIMSYDTLELVVSRDKFMRKAQRVIDKCSNQTVRNIMTNFATTVANIRYNIEKAIAKAKKKKQGQEFDDYSLTRIRPFAQS